MANRLFMRPLGAILGGAAALWISAGALALTSAESGGRRIGIVPSPWWLLTALAVAFVAAYTVRRQRGRAIVVWLSALALLPWLPFDVPPAVLVWAGGLRSWVWIAVAVALAAPIAAGMFHSKRLRAFTDPRHAPRIAASVAALVYLLIAWRIAPQIPGGDEPHYLVIAQSLLRDGDLKIENNHQRGDSYESFPLPPKPDYIRRGVNGEIYSIHAPGLPAVVAPALALFGYHGVVVFLALISAWATAMAWMSVWRVTGNAEASWFGWATVALSVPFVFHAFTAYPDGLGAALVMAGVLTALIDREASRRQLVAAGCALALLPWVHTRFAISACALAVVIGARQLSASDRLQRLGAFAMVPVLSAAAWFGFFYAVYGTPNPAAPYGGSAQTTIGNIPRGLTGLLLDQQFGMLPNAPVYICALAGFGTMARRQPRIAAELALLIGPYAVASAAYYMWWGGHSSPARFLVSVLLPMAIPSGVWFARSGTAARVLAGGTLLVSVLMTSSLAWVDRGALLYNVRDGASRFLQWLAPLVNLPAGLPSLFQTGPLAALARGLVWLLALAAAGGVGAWLSRRRAATAVVVVGVGLTAGVLGTAALTLIWSRSESGTVTAANAGPSLLRAIDPDANQLAIRFQPLERLRVLDVPPLLPILSRWPATNRPEDPLASVSRPPAATYAIEAVVTGDAGRLSVGIDRYPGPLWTWDLRSFRGTWRQSVTLPVAAWQLRVDGDESTRAAISTMTIRAERIPDSRARITDREAFRAARYGPATLFFLGGSAFMELGGTWVAARASADFAIATDPGATIQLLVRNSGVDNTVTIESRGGRHTLMLRPHEERLLDVAADPGRAGAVVRVRTAAGARPADLEPGNQDRRLLGVWIETR